MLSTLAGHWGLVLFRGIVSILFGFAALIWPGLTLFALVILFGAYALVDGVAALVIAMHNRGRPGFGVLIALGLIGIAAGVLTFLYPGITAVALLGVIAAWAILSGVAGIVAAIVLRKELEGEWVLILSGVVSLVFAVLLLLNPRAGAIAVAWMIGFYAILSGIMLVALALRLRQLQHGLAAA
jgi:uncharacterized membrane protein HdeD (DUF308 family)